MLHYPDLEAAAVTSSKLTGTSIDAEYPGLVGAADLAFVAHSDPALAVALARMLVAACTIDSLGKGAAGQVLQCANIVCG